VPLEKLIPAQLAQKLPTDSDTRRSSTSFTTVALLAVPDAMNTARTVPFYSFKTRFDVALPSVSGSSKWSPCFRFSLHNLAYLSVRIHSSVPRRCVNLQIDRAVKERRHAPIKADRSAIARMRKYIQDVNSPVNLCCSAVARTRSSAFIVGQGYLPTRTLLSHRRDNEAGRWTDRHILVRW